MPFFGKGPKSPEGEKVESPQEKAQRIFKEIMNKVKNDLGSWAEGLLLLKHDAKYGIMTLIDGALQRITFFYGAYKICSEKPEQATKIVGNLGVPKSEIAVCVAFLCHACKHEKVGAAVKSDLRGRPNLKFIIKDIIDFFGGKGFRDTNVESITIITIDDNSYKVVIQLKLLSKEIEYLLDW